MLKLKKIAVTGGLSCGKTSVCRIFKELGAYVVSADEIVHQLLSPTTKLGKDVIKLVGDDVLVGDLIDRSKIAKKVFNHPELLLSLEKLLHPAVSDEIERQYRQVFSNGTHPLFVAEIPLLFESDTFGGADYDATVAVIADEAVCRRRYIESRGSDDGEYERRMARQIPPRVKAERATYVIQNNGSYEELRRATASLYPKLIQT